MPTFSTSSALKKEILRRSNIAISNVRDEIYKVIDANLNIYYGEYDPVEYIRTQQLMRSLVKTNVFTTGSGVEAEVYFDAGALNYQNGEVLLQSGNYGWATWGAEEVLDTAMHGSHGGYTDGTPIWDKSMSDLGNIISKIVKALIAAGLPVK